MLLSEASKIWVDGSRVSKIWLGGVLVWWDPTVVGVGLTPGLGSAAGLPLAVSAGVAVVLPVAGSDGAALPFTANVATPLSVALGSANGLAVEVASGAAVALPVAAGSAAGLPFAVATGVVLPFATGSADGLPFTFGAGAGVVAPIATSTAAALAFAVGAAAAVDLPAATSSAAGLDVTPAVAPNFSPSGMTKNGTMAWPDNGGSVWTLITSWTANTGTYPGSSVTSDRLNVQGSKSNATISASIPFTGGSLNRTHTIRLVDQSGNVIATGSGVTANNGTCTVTANNVDLAAITSVGVQMQGGTNFNGTVSATGTLTIT